MKSLIYTKTISTPIGDMKAGATDKGICQLVFMDDTDGLIFTADDFEYIENTNTHLTLLENELSNYFDQKLEIFTTPLHFIGTEFQQRVWQALVEIPFGETRSYLEQAKLLGDINAIRAVASANGKNPIAIVVPCHRVIGSNGSLTGYAGKLWRKKYLLNLESQQLSLFN